MTQTSLLDFKTHDLVLENDNASLFYTLEEIGYTKSHEVKILQLLWDLELHASKEVQVAGGSQYNARIHKLRSLGWDIRSTRVSKVGFMFNLVSRSQSVHASLGRL